MLTGKYHESHRAVRRQLMALGFATLIAIATAVAPVLSDTMLDTSVVPAASACGGGQHGGGDC